MNDLQTLRSELHSKISSLPENIKIPQKLKNDLRNEWGRCVSVNEESVTLETNAGNDSFSDLDLLKACYAKDLTQSLISFRELLQSFLNAGHISPQQTKELNASITPKSRPSWWSSVASLIEVDSDLSPDEKNYLNLFALDNKWSGCTKGAGRVNDFFHSSVVNALDSNVTHNSILAVAAKELLDLSTPRKIIEWHEKRSSGYTGEGNDLLSLLSEAMMNFPSKFSYGIILATLTKPFTILTGSSGTGKTKLAESLAYSMRNAEDAKDATNVAIVPVGADWTDNRHVLGFVNHLNKVDPEGTNRPIYQSTPVLDLLIEATTNSDTPHFLVLDEMNLSHVERYFADFLSAMEQTDGRLNLHSEGPRDVADYTLPRYEGDEVGVPRFLYYPANLFVIGTVNIDETTYMFSPKVLDRANVIEFKVGHKELANFLNEPKALAATAKADDGVAEAFLQLAEQVSKDELEALPSDAHKAIQAHLMDLFDIMQAGRFEFAYRTGKEVMRYLGVCHHLAENKETWDNTDWKSDLDDQILQKILPKLHGSIGRVGPLLANLADYCHQGKTAAEPTGLKAILELAPNDAAFKKSFTKLQSMIRTLLDEQFVSFIQ